MPITLGANDEAKISLTYEYVLSQKEDTNNYVLSLSPGERVADFQVSFSILDDADLSSVSINAPVIGSIVEQRDVGNRFQHNFNMSLVDQDMYFGKHGFTGDLVLQFSMQHQEVSIVVFT